MGNGVHSHKIKRIRKLDLVYYVQIKLTNPVSDTCKGRMRDERPIHGGKDILVNTINSQIRFIQPPMSRDQIKSNQSK